MCAGDIRGCIDHCRHFDAPTHHALKTIKYHGQHRHTTTKDLDAADIVITTYHTLASDFTGTKSVLQNLEWYRLVLDEGLSVQQLIKSSLTGKLQPTLYDAKLLYYTEPWRILQPDRGGV
jgi:hypothetical protein